MLSQLNLRFHKKLIGALKARAGAENVSVNALAERFLDDGLKTATPEDSYLQLVSDPHAAMHQMYAKIVLGQTFGGATVSRNELRYLLGLAQEGYVTGQRRLVTRPALQTLLDITRELLVWQTEHGMPQDISYMKGTFRLKGENPAEECADFIAQLRPVIGQDYAERLVRPLACGGFELNTFPDEALARIFTQPRLQQIFPLALRAQGWREEDAQRMADALRPAIPAAREVIRAGSLQVEIRIDGQQSGERPGAWYYPPQLHLLITGKEFVFPCGWAPFAELLGLFTLYVRHPEALSHGHQGEHVMFSPPGDVTEEGFFGIRELRIFMPPEAFEKLARELSTRCAEGSLAEALTGLRCLYGDL
ncbi:transcriptional regulator [uncultured Leclercia sp.]|uniref:transcriptional regulator n=1 Tax=uncultured Leclercia sp. TaxID=332959 RepID=UPI002598841C|nr:transcriptional regulator [uncultured Leclercia sp.]